MNKMQADVEHFHINMGLPFVDKTFGKPAPLSVDQANLRLALIEEELEELSDAMADDDMIETIDALCDILYVTFGTAVELGIDLEPFWDEIQRSNMTKTPGNKSASGKLMKGPRYEMPDLARVYKETYTNGCDAR